MIDPRTDHELLVEAIGGELAAEVGGWLRGIVGAGVAGMNLAIPPGTAKKALARVVGGLTQEPDAPPIR